ncbi:mRNA turnover protein 4 homolog [Chelonus insularis]|uniref:mRNA turnover protein 4 homolog n=1 Tax=Chelonus insularis TaxID=460826 RepID=UPI00158F5E16|nr:mRNA turnover protein 4 homolog [Chelonus insularis]
MPKSKRDKKISLTKTSKKGKALKQHIVNDVRSCIEKYERIFLFSVRNMRNNKLKDLREDWKADSRFFFGKNKIIALAMGLTPETEVADGIHKLAKSLKGQCGLLFTNKLKNKVLEWMNNYAEEEYARAGFIAPETIVLPEGPLPEFSHAIEPHLRQLGMPTTLQKGVVTLVKEFEACKKGQPLTPEQARILKLFGNMLAEFRLIPLGFYSKKKGYKRLKTTDSGENHQEEMETENTNET